MVKGKSLYGGSSTNKLEDILKSVAAIKGGMFVVTLIVVALFMIANTN